MERLKYLAGTLIGIATFAVALRRLLSAESGDQERLFCIALTLALAFFLVVAARRIGFGFLIAGAIIGSIWLAATLKLSYLDEPLMAPDLDYFLTGTTLDVILHYPGIWKKLALAIVGGLLLVWFLWRWESPPAVLRRRPVLHTGAALLALVPLALVVSPQGPFRDIHSVGTWDFLQEAHDNPMTGFVRSFSRMLIKSPSYTLANASREDWSSSGGAIPPEQLPDIIAVLEESTLDPRQWAACNVPRCTFPLFQPDEHTDAAGLLKVHTYGGATWTSEFAFLTGLPHPLFGPAGTYAPYNLAPRVRESLPRQLKALGYRSIAIYPMPHDFVHAGTAYGHYGFDAFFDATDLGLIWGSSDSEVMQRFQTVLRQQRELGDEPLFFMILTMRQHGPHEDPLDTLPAPWNEPLPDLDADLGRNLANYLHRLNQSSLAIAELRHDLFASGRPTVLAHFGDHHPAFEGLERQMASTLPPELRDEASQLTYFRIDSNLAEARRPMPATLDIAFLGGLILDVAGLPKNAYYQANTRLRERCEGRFLDCPQTAVYESWLARTFGELEVLAP